jgi:hypothetical protein
MHWWISIANLAVNKERSIDHRKVHHSRAMSKKLSNQAKSVKSLSALREDVGEFKSPEIVALTPIKKINIPSTVEA